MSRLAIPSAEQTSSASAPLLEAVQKQLGVTPNLMRLVGNSAPALEGYLSLNGALGNGKLSVQLRERIALAVAQFNGCDYCLSAHDYLGRNVAKLSGDEIAAARLGTSSDHAVAAALAFAMSVANHRGHIADAELDAVRAAGFGDAEIIEIVGAVALNILTNYVNNVAQTDIDFPVVRAIG